MVVLVVVAEEGGERKKALDFNLIAHLAGKCKNGASFSRLLQALSQLVTHGAKTIEVSSWGFSGADLLLLAFFLPPLGVLQSSNLLTPLTK